MKKIFAVALVVHLVLTVAGCSKAINVDERIKVAAARETAGQLSSAIIELKNILQQDPNYAPARLAMGRIYLKLGDTKAALKELDKALALKADDREAVVLRLRAKLLAGRYGQVIEYLEKSSDQMTPATAATLGGRAYLGLGDVRKAAELFKQALDVDATANEAALGMAQIDLVTGQNEEAAKKIAVVLARDPTSADALIEQGKVELLQAQGALAVKTYEQAVKADPYRASAYLGLATAQLAVGDPAAAEKSAKRAGDLVPTSSVAAYLYAFALYKQGREDETLQILYNLMKVFPGHPQCHLLAAEILTKKNQIHQAEDILIPAVTRHPRYVPATVMLALVQLRQGNPKAVIERLTALAKDGLATQEVYSLLGSAYLQAKDFESAAQALQKAASLIADPAQAKIFSARSHLATGNPELAVNDLEQALAANPDFTQADAMLILAHLKRNEVAAALPIAEKLLAKRPNEPQAHELLARVHDAAGRTAEARRYYEETLALDKSYIPAALRLAELDYQDGKIAQVEARFDALLKEPLPNEGLAAVLLSKAKLARGKQDATAGEALLLAALAKDPGNVDALLELAFAAESKGDFKTAHEFLGKARELNPAAIKPRTVLARHLIARKDYTGALEVAQEAYQLDKGNPEVLYTLGECYRAVGKPKEAMKVYEQAIAAGGKDVELYFGYAAAASAVGDSVTRDKSVKSALDAAHEALSAAADANNLKEDQLLALGRLELLRKDFGQAQQYVTRIQSKFPDRPEGYELEGDRLVALDERNAAAAVPLYEKAVALGAGHPTIAKLARLFMMTGTGNPLPLLTQWLDKHPDDAELRVRLAQALLQAGDKPGSIVQLEKLAHDVPGNISILNNLAALYQEVGDARALEVAERASALAPNDSTLKDTYGWILVSRNSLEKGLTLLRQAASELPREPSVQYHFASALLQSGNRPEAARTISKIKALDKDYPEKAEVAKLAKQLE